MTEPSSAFAWLIQGAIASLVVCGFAGAVVLLSSQPTRRIHTVTSGLRRSCCRRPWKPRPTVKRYVSAWRTNSRIWSGATGGRGRWAD